MSASPDNIDYQHTSNVARMHAAVAREKSDPMAQSTPVSLGIIAAIAGIAMIAGSYYGANKGADLSVANTKGYDYPRTFAGVKEIGGGEMTPLEKHQPANWIAFGQSVYANSCSSCHQPDGGGVPGQFPHLKNSEFVINGEELLTAILLHGIAGNLTVDGKAFTGVMMPLGTTSLNDTQLAQVLSYIRNSWGNTASVIYEDQIKEARKTLGTRASYSDSELRALDKTKALPPSKWPDELKKAAGGAAPAAPPAPAPAAK